MTFEFDQEEFDEAERYELRDLGSYRFNANRREFVQVLGAGLAVLVSTDVSSAQAPGGRRGQRPRSEEKLSQRFHISDDGVVTVLTSKVEVGQGSRTQIAQATAEEFRIPMEQVRVIMADTEVCPDDGGTAGSRTTPSTIPRVQNAAAAAREVLATFAAKKLGVDRSTLKVEAGVFHTDDEHRITLAELAKAGQIADELSIAPPANVTITLVQEWSVLGKSVPKALGQQVVTGAARYPSDIVRPNMLYGKVLRPASYNARLMSIDLAPAKEMEGTVVVRDGDFVGIAAPSSWQAAKALDAVSATAKWERPEHPSSERLFELLKTRDGAANGSRPRESAWGNRQTAFAAAGKKLDAAYTVAYIQHAPMEPRAAVAEWQDGKLTVWTGSQQPSRVHEELRQAFRLSGDRIRVIVPDTGGGFGGKHTGEAAVEAAKIAQAAGRPVSLRWTREEEFTWAYFRPAGLIEVQAALDPSGALTAWDFTNYNSGGSAIDTPYKVPHGRTRFVSSTSPLKQGSYRALASTANTFARESAMDELATMASIDPLDFRLKYLEDGRLKNVLQAAAEKFEWRSRHAKKTPHRGTGLACGTEKGSYTAACVEVEVIENKIRVLSVCQAFECGAIHNPENVRAQVEGAIIMGLGGALMEAIHFKDGKVTNASFSSYRVPHIDDVPPIETVLLDRKDLPSVGAGETPIIAIAPAIANAIYDAMGVRCRSMPLKLAQTGGKS